MKRLAIYFACLLAMPLATRAQSTGQTLAAGAIKVENMIAERTGGNMVVDMDLNMDELSMPSNMRFVFTPIVRSGSSERLLPQVIVSGRKSDISFRRSGHSDYADDVLAVRRKNNTAQTVHYSAVVPYEEWMRNSDVVVAEDLCGCNKLVDQSTITLRKLRTPSIPYVRPAADPKERHLGGSAFIDFPVNKTELYPSYRKNPRELRKIIDTINVVRGDRNATITRVDIHGYASPESPYDHNAYLAEHRAKTLKDYVRDLVSVPDSKFSVSSTPEDWDGLRRFVDASSLQHRVEILALIDDKSLDPDAKEWRIKSSYPEEYRHMLDEWYPALRHSDYEVYFTVRPFTVDEAREMIKTDPRQLSLEEMYLLAQTYESGSEEFNEVMETAVRLYPDDATANLNAACTHMQGGDYEAARRYLAKAGDSADAVHARGVLAMLEGDADSARSLLTKASEGGAAGAAGNLSLLDL